MFSQGYGHKVTAARWACSLAGLLVLSAVGGAQTMGIDPQSMAPTVRILRGEITGESGERFDDLTVELVKENHTIDRAAVASDGAFEFHDIAEGQYEVRILNLQRNVIQRDFRSVRENFGPLVVRLPTRNDKRPVSGVVSAKRLRHPVPAKALREFARAENAFQKGDVQESCEHLEKAIQIYPDYMEAHNNLGARRMRRGDSEGAATEFQKAAELDPAAALANTNLALALLNLKRNREAETAARRALQIDPAFLPARYALGLSSAAQDDCSLEAVGNLQKAAEQYPQARLAAARLLVCRGQTGEAADQLRAYLASPKAENTGTVTAWLGRLQGVAPQSAARR